VNRIVSVFLVLVVGGAAFAAEPSDLYRGRTIVTGIKDETRIPAAPICLLDVLAKVSGDARLLNDPRAREVAATATLHATEYSYRDRYALRQIHDEQGTRDRPYYLTVTFDQQRVDAALQTLGRKPWTAMRPRLALFLAVQNGPTFYVLSSDGQHGRDQRESLEAASWQTGMPVVLPGEAALARGGLNAETLAGADLAKLAELTKSLGADLAVVGTLAWNKGTLGWAASWQLLEPDGTHRWEIRDVNFDDAFRNALRGSAQILSGNGEPE
jgi:hypothetical protein